MGKNLQAAAYNGTRTVYTCRITHHHSISLRVPFSTLFRVPDYNGFVSIFANIWAGGCTPGSDGPEYNVMNYSCIISLSVFPFVL